MISHFRKIFVQNTTFLDCVFRAIRIAGIFQTEDSLTQMYQVDAAAIATFGYRSSPTF